MTQPNIPALKEAIQNSLAALKMIEGSFFEGSPEQRAIETALHSIEESAALQRETGGEAVAELAGQYAAKLDAPQGTLLFNTRRLLQFASAITASLESKLSQLRAANGETKEHYIERLPADWFEDSSLETWFPLTSETIASLTQQIADAKGRLAWKERDGKCAICGKLTNAISAGIPDLWPLVFPKPGEMEDSFWHAGCVRNALHERDELKARLEEAEKAIRIMLASAHPHPEEHPVMHAAWLEGEAALNGTPRPTQPGEVR